MLIKFRDILAKLPSVFFLTWIFLFFADTANLDDLLLKCEVLHTEIPISIFEYSATSLHTSLECTNSSKQITFKNNVKPSKATHYIVDEDSPTINANDHLQLSAVIFQIINNKSIPDIHIFSNSLYLQNCELLI